MIRVYPQTSGSANPIHPASSAPGICCSTPFAGKLGGMTKEATQLMAEALKRVDLNESFSPADIGHRVGMNRFQAEAAARALSDAGVLVLGFDCAAAFTSEFRKAQKRDARVRKPARQAARRARRLSKVD